MIDVPEEFACPECGGPAARITPLPEEGFAAGDVVAYRCRDCRDRLDVEVPVDEEP